jgi:hypothetical protein
MDTVAPRRAEAMRTGTRGAPRVAVLVFVLATASAAGSATAEAQEPDFHILLDTCKLLVGYSVMSNESLKVIAADPVYNACTRQSRRVSCVLTFPGDAHGVKGNAAEYTVVVDSPPHLHFTDERYADYFAVNLSTRAVVLTTRFLSEKSSGAKVCHGIFATDDEVKALRDKR